MSKDKMSSGQIEKIQKTKKTKQLKETKKKSKTKQQLAERKKISPEQKKTNRRNLLMFILTIIMMKYSWNFYQELKGYEDTLGKQRMRNISIFDDAKILREQGFYNNQNYLNNIIILKKSWNKNAIGGINFNGSGEED